MKTLVIGGTGFIGRNILRSLDPKETSYFSRKQDSDLSKAGYQWIGGSITEKDQIGSAIKDFELIIHAAGIFEEKDQKFQEVNLTGIKNIVDPIKSADRNQRLVYISCINVDFAPMEFFHSRRLTEGNVSTIKNSLIVRTSVIFGEGDRITSLARRIASSDLSKFPETGNLAPVHVGDLVKVILANGDTRGSIFVASREAISLKRAANLLRSRMGRKPLGYVKPKERKIDKFFSKLENAGEFNKETLAIYSLNYFRENTILYRYVNEPRKFEDYLNQVPLK